MTMKARFPGECKACGAPIVVGDDIEWSKGVGARHATQVGCAAAKKLAGGISETKVVGMKVDGLVAFLTQAAVNGLKAPKARFLGPEGKGELRLALAKHGSKHPGSVYVQYNGAYLGSILPGGDVKGALLHQQDVIQVLLFVVKDPAKAAAQYGAVMGRCSFCGLKLTDAGSVAVGYGPICAEKWELPHVYVGTPVLKQLPV
jgi:hypothetical protein